MLRRWNINTSHTDVMVAPIQMENFHKEGDQWVFDNVTKGNPDIIRPDNSKVESSALNSLNHQLDQDYLNNNLDEFMAAPIAVEASTQDIISRVKETVEKWFPVYGNIKQKTDEEVKELINDQLGDNWLDASTNSYRFQPKGSNQTIEVVNDHPGAEAEFFRKVKEWYQGYNERLIKRTAKIADALEKG
jgi:outer membrane PBP1 activator LpoA protein